MNYLFDNWKFVLKTFFNMEFLNYFHSNKVVFYTFFFFLGLFIYFERESVRVCLYTKMSQGGAEMERESQAGSMLLAGY